MIEVILVIYFKFLISIHAVTPLQERPFQLAKMPNNKMPNNTRF